MAVSDHCMVFMDVFIDRVLRVGDGRHPTLDPEVPLSRAVPVVYLFIVMC